MEKTTNTQIYFEDGELNIKKSPPPSNIFVGGKSRMIVKSNPIKKKFPQKFVEAVNKLKSFSFYAELNKYSDIICKIFLSFKHTGIRNSDIIYVIFRFITINKIDAPSLAHEIRQVFPNEIKKMVSKRHWIYQYWINLSLESRDVSLVSNRSLILDDINDKIKALISIYKYGMIRIEADCQSIIYEFLEKMYNTTDIYLKPFIQEIFVEHKKSFASFLKNKYLTYALNHPNRFFNELSPEDLFDLIAYFILILNDIGSSIIIFISDYEYSLYSAIKETDDLFESTIISKAKISTDISIEDIPFLLFEMKNFKLDLSQPHNIPALISLKEKINNFIRMDVKTHSILQKYLQQFIRNLNSTTFHRKYFEYRDLFIENIVAKIYQNNPAILNSNSIIGELIKESLRHNNTIHKPFNRLTTFIKFMPDLDVNFEQRTEEINISDLFNLRFNLQKQS